MQNSMFSALFGALSNEHRLNSITNNLANVNTTGYKRDMVAFRDTFVMFAHDQMMEATSNIRAEKHFPEPQHAARPRLALSYTDFQQGSLKVTGAPLDLAISGDGFFKVLTPDGEEMYTRNGHFRLTSEGVLVTEQGFPVVGDGGEITIPPGLSDILIAEDGRIFGDGDLVGQVALVDVDPPSDLEKLGHNLYRPRQGAEIEEQESESFIVQGFLEGANVDAVYEMVNMIEAHRQFEAYAKIMQATDAIDKEAHTRVGRGRS